METHLGSTTTSSTISSPSSKNTRHLSIFHEKMNAKKMKLKQIEIEQAVKYCRENNCKGYKAIADLGLKSVKDGRTINQHLMDIIIAQWGVCMGHYDICLFININ